MRFAIALLAVACALGCQTAKDPFDHRGALVTAQKKYTNLIRWRDAERAAVFIVPERRARFLELAGNLELMEISDYELGEIEYGADDMTASVDVTYRGYSLAHLIERKIRVTQKWERDENDQWHVDPDLDVVVAKLRGEAPPQ
jgi:hypothetical protein